MAASSHIPRMLFVLSCFTLISSCASAWSNGGYSADQNNPDYGTHDWIADAALTIQTRDVTFLKTTYHSRFLLGTEAPDNPDYIGDTANHHIYYYSTGVLQDDICAVRASQIYETALGYMTASDYDNAAYDIGVLAHYVADPGVFGHTMGAHTDWGTETHHSDYESEFESIISSLPAPTGTTLGDSDAYFATLELGKNITFGSGTIKPNIWMDANYDWTDDTFVASAMASLYASVAAVAAVVNHLMIETALSLPTPEAPQPPASLTAIVEGAHVVLSWTPPPSDGGAEITGYVIYRGTDPESPSILASVPGDTYSWTDESVEKGKTYYYWIVAENSVGSSDMIRIASATLSKNSNSLTLSVALLAISGALASGGILLWRSRRRGKPLS